MRKLAFIFAGVVLAAMAAPASTQTTSNQAPTQPNETIVAPQVEQLPSTDGMHGDGSGAGMDDDHGLPGDAVDPSAEGAPDSSTFEQAVEQQLLGLLHDATIICSSDSILPACGMVQAPLQHI